MKKVLSLLIVFLLVVALASCDKGSLGVDDPSSTTTTVVAATTTLAGETTTLGEATTTVSTTIVSTTTAVETTANTNTDVDEIVAILSANSYLLTTHDASSIQYFTANTLVSNYGIDVTVTDLIMGDVSASDWIQLIGFASEADAIAYANVLSTLDGGELYYRNGTAVLLTYSQTALNLFN